MDYQATNWDHCLQHAALSDVGMRRANNQDSLVVALASSQQDWLQRGHLFMVADGMGAHAAGELASKLATDNIPLSYHKLMDRPAPEALRKAIHDANELIHKRGQASEDFWGMGTTSTVLLLLPQGAIVGHVGDSRAYRVRNACIDQLTFDHSLVWEVKAAGQMPAEEVPNYVPKNIITRSLGPNPTVEADLEGPFPVQPGDTFLLCSDGLSGPINDKELGTILHCLPPKDAVRALVDLANLRGGPDNISAIVVRVTGSPTAQTAGSPSLALTGQTAPRPVHPLVWTLLAVFGLATVGMLAMEQWAAALVGLIGAAAASVAAMLQRYAPAETQVQFSDRPLGRGPYARCDSTPNREFVDQFAQIARELRDAATKERWNVDWNHFNALQGQAAAAKEVENWCEAVRQYWAAISFMMNQLRQLSGRKPPGDDSVVGM